MCINLSECHFDNHYSGEEPIADLNLQFLLEFKPFGLYRLETSPGTINFDCFYLFLNSKYFMRRRNPNDLQHLTDYHSSTDCHVVKKTLQ